MKFVIGGYDRIIGRDNQINGKKMVNLIQSKEEEPKGSSSFDW